ncbi:MAG: protein tonB [Lysobacter sp.]|nr:protein tonB [Lysobacter sp.]
MRRLLILCLLLVCSFAVSAENGPGAVRKQIESALYVTGTIDITPAGDVVAHTLDQPEKLPRGIVDMAARLLPQWKFEPVALQDKALSRSKMSLLFVGRKLDDGRYSVELRSAVFSDNQANESIRVDPRSRRLPIYPIGLADAEISGAVFLLVKIGRDGKVIDLDVSHVNLRVIGSESEMKQWRNMFARNSIAAAKRWTFITPTSGPDADKPFWIGTLPFDYSIKGQERPAYGQWQTYVAGPKAVIPWQDESLMADGNTDALTPNMFHAAGSGRRLLTPLAGG